MPPHGFQRDGSRRTTIPCFRPVVIMSTRFRVWPCGLQSVRPPIHKQVVEFNSHLCGCEPPVVRCCAHQFCIRHRVAFLQKATELRPQRLRVPSETGQPERPGECFKLVLPEPAVTAFDWEGERIEGLPTPVIDVETTRFRIVRNHQKQQRTFGEVQPPGNPCLSSCCETQNGSILIQLFQTKIPLMQDISDAYLLHTELLFLF